MKEIVYVIGHRNPDTDCTVAACAYAYLKRQTGMLHARAARAGKMNPQTEYVFDRFNVEPPEFIPDLIPEVQYFMSEAPTCLDADTPLWDALNKMNESGGKALPIVDAEMRYRSTLHYAAFAQNILRKINPHKKALISTSLTHLISTIQAQPIIVFNETAQFKAHMVVATLDFESFKRHVDAEMKENTIIIVGDREDVQDYAIESKVRAIIVTNGLTVSAKIKAKAEKNGVSIIISPYDTSSTSLLVIYSTPVWTMGDDTISPVREDQLMRSARKNLSASPARALPVVNSELKVTGMLQEGDAVKDPCVDLILVDHNELSQAVEGAENYRILEIIDHHRLGSFATKNPITFINKPVGATSTIVATLFREQKIPLTKEIASILLCAILSDTLVLKSATTTDTDRETAEYLANITDLSIEALGLDLMTSASLVGKMSCTDIIKLDLKEYTASNKKFSISQIEVTGPSEILERRSALLEELEANRVRKGLYFSALMVTDITDLTSLLVISCDKDFYNLIKYPRVEDNIFILKDILSRKKQLVPVLLELVEQAQG